MAATGIQYVHDAACRFSIFDAAMQKRTMDEIVLPTVRAMAKAGSPFKGVLYVGVMIDKDGPRLVEFNCRFGDPECQVLMMRLKSISCRPCWPVSTEASTTSTCAGPRRLPLPSSWRPRAIPTSTLGQRDPGLDEAAKVEGVQIFHAAAQGRSGSRILANGGRVLEHQRHGADRRGGPRPRLPGCGFDRLARRLLPA